MLPLKASSVLWGVRVRTFLLTGLMAICWLSQTAWADQKLYSSGIKFIGFPKEGRLEADGTGHIADLINKVLTEAGASDSLITAPVRRARRLLETTHDACIVFSTKDLLPHYLPALKPEQLIESVPIDLVSSHLVTRTGSKPVTNPRTLEGKTIGSWVGVDVANYLPNMEYTWVKTESEETTVRMLVEGRYDAIWSWLPDVHILTDRLGVDKLVLDEQAHLFAVTTHIVCKKTLKAELFMPRLNNILNVMRVDGRLKKILGEHARIVGVDVPIDVKKIDIPNQQ